MGKKVIFIGGASYSGSTLFDLILSNDPGGFSCGEISAAYRPFRVGHFKKEEKLIRYENRNYLWSKIITKGEKELYTNLFNLFPKVEFIVDSSKNPFWIKDQLGYLKKRNIEAKVILIWKLPLDAFASYHKRNRKTEFYRNWVNYHRLFFTVINNYHAIGYHEIVNDENAMKTICELIGIEYNKDKYKYWNKKHYTLYGNTSAKMHLERKNEKHYLKMKEYLIYRTNTDEKKLTKNYQQIYYENNHSCNLINEYERFYKNDKKIQDIHDVLKDRSIGACRVGCGNSQENIINGIKLTDGELTKRRIKQELITVSYKLLRRCSQIFSS